MDMAQAMAEEMSMERPMLVLLLLIIGTALGAWALFGRNRGTGLLGGASGLGSGLGGANININGLESGMGTANGITFSFKAWQKGL